MRSIYQSGRSGRPSRRYSKANELDRKLVDKVFGAAESTFKTDFLFLVNQLSDAIDEEIVTMALNTGDITNVIMTTEKLALGLQGAWAEVYQEGGDAAAGFISDAQNLRVRFDLQNQRAIGAVQQNSLALIREVTDEQRTVFRDILTDGITQGLNPRVVARDLRDSVGLTQYQQQVVDNYRTLLERGSAQAMDRQLHDARFDPTIQRAISADKPIPASAIERMVDRYRQNWINYRAETIARTEGLRAASMGIQEGFQQAVDSENIDEEAVTRTWKTQMDGLERDSHADMDGQVRGLNEPFISGLGNELMIPRDPSAPPEDSIQCRCRLLYRLR